MGSNTYNNVHNLGNKFETGFFQMRHRSAPRGEVNFGNEGKNISDGIFQNSLIAEGHDQISVVLVVRGSKQHKLLPL